MRYIDTWQFAQVVQVQQITPNVLELHLLPGAGTQPFSVGAHLALEVYINDLPEIRHYSLLGTYSPHSPYKIAVKRLPNSRGGSRFMWTLQVGSRVRISQPKTNFELSRNARDYVLLAGGIGITPLLGMAQALSQKSDISVRMLYLGTSRQEMPFVDVLQDALGDRLQLHYSDTQGMCSSKVLLQGVTPTTQVYLCGPIALMQLVRSLWVTKGLPPENLRFETFASSGNFPTQKFTVHLPRFNTSIEVQKNETLLQALEKAEVQILSDCKKGECGLCQVDILEYTGQIDHRDLFFSDIEKSQNNKLCACVSRISNGSITIDTGFRE